LQGFQSTNRVWPSLLAHVSLYRINESTAARLLNEKTPQEIKARRHNESKLTRPPHHTILSHNAIMGVAILLWLASASEKLWSCRISSLFTTSPVSHTSNSALRMDYSTSAWAQKRQWSCYFVGISVEDDAQGVPYNKSTDIYALGITICTKDSLFVDLRLLHIFASEAIWLRAVAIFPWITLAGRFNFFDIRNDLRTSRISSFYFQENQREPCVFS
jgi:hypothetical protein